MFAGPASFFPYLQTLLQSESLNHSQQICLNKSLWGFIELFTADLFKTQIKEGKAWPNLERNPKVAGSSLGL